VSGHSVISTAAAEVLGYYLGSTYAYTDTTEHEFGLRARYFTSFGQAAEEAAISRLYEGIHFLDAIQQGQVLGQKIGVLAVQRLCSSASAIPPRVARTSAACHSSLLR
jgi:hypothetical protein